MPSYKLSYFDAKGRGEAARLLFVAAGKDYEDERLAGEKWLAFKPSTPYGQMPVLTVDGKMINQSGAIFRFLAREFDMYGSNNMENTKCDVVMETVNDVFTEMIKVYFEKDEAKKAEVSKNFIETVLPKFYGFIAKMLKDNGGKFLVGSKMTVADIIIFDLIDKITDAPVFGGEGSYSKFPEIKGFYQSIKSNPKIKAWLEKRPKTEN